MYGTHCKLSSYVEVDMKMYDNCVRQASISTFETAFGVH